MPIYTGDMKVNDTNVSVTPDALAPAENGLTETRSVGNLVLECEHRSFDKLPLECFSADDGVINLAENGLTETRSVGNLVLECEHRSFDKLPPECFSADDGVINLECNLKLPPDCWSVDDGFNSADVTINGDINFYDVAEII